MIQEQTPSAAAVKDAPHKCKLIIPHYAPLAMPLQLCFKLESLQPTG